MAEQQTERHALNRRALIAGAAALVAGIAAKQAAQPVVADTFLIPGSYSAVSTAAVWAITNPGTGVGIFGASSGTGEFAGVKGYSNSASGGLGVFGVGSLGGTGVFGSIGGHDVSGFTNVGVGGQTDRPSGIGVQGTSASGNGVSGESTSAIGIFGTSANNHGILGNTDGGTGMAGVVGSSGGFAGSFGVMGNGFGGVGVYGNSTSGYGVLGYTTGGSASLSGISTNANIPAFAGGNSVAGGLAASFGGTVYVNGMFVVQDVTQKHGLLKHPDGSHRLMYTVEAPESWVEDFGRAQLVGGKAEVSLDLDFAALIHTDDYHVFLTPHADTNGLHVTTHGPRSFTVQEHKGGTASLTFSYRVVAKPKSDRKVERLGKFVVPNVPLPDVTKLPKPETRRIPKKP